MIGESIAKVSAAFLFCGTLYGAEQTNERAKNFERAKTATEYEQLVIDRNSVSPAERKTRQPEFDARLSKIARERGQIERK